MEAPVMLKVMFQGSILNDLPAELKYRILDLLDASSLKKCRLLNKNYLNLIDNCEKYTKHWILDVSGWPVTADQEFVELYTNSGMNFGRFVGDTNKFLFVPKLFQKLGKTVKHLKNLPFSSMDRKTTEAMIETFNNVEYLKMTDNILLCNMKRWGLVWPSVKRLSILCGGRNDLAYKGNFSEFPNIEDITIGFFSLLLGPALKLIKLCPEKITDIREKLILLSDCDPGPELVKIDNLKLKRLKMRYDAEDGKDVFLPTQNEITSYAFRTQVSYRMSHYEYGKVLPEHIDLQYVHDLQLELMCESPIWLDCLKNMTNLAKLNVTLMPEFRHYRSDELKTCFLQHHWVELNTKVTKLELDTRGLPETCHKCIRNFVSSFPKVQHLSFTGVAFENLKDFQHFWKMVNDVLKKTGMAQHLITFRVYFSDYESAVDSSEYNLFKILTPLPIAIDVELHMKLTKLTQNNLHMLCKKIPAVKKLIIGIKPDMDFNLTGFLISQLKYLKYLKLSHYPNGFFDENYVEHVAGPDLIDTLLKVDLKLWELELKIQCETEDVYPLFEKFPTLKKLKVFKKGISEEDDKITEVDRTDFYNHMKSRPT
ncbi:uncharacterized protein LOC134830551 [Culicoides brevitarsis]|uniref:uncharacterized protein LOC134830551 n=1 Tax=Culicoides brevitarsis TaxID=469753 RepID=UPI00307C4536